MDRAPIMDWLAFPAERDRVKQKLDIYVFKVARGVYIGSLKSSGSRCGSEGESLVYILYNHEDTYFGRHGLAPDDLPRPTE